jgi:hypothetical protein
VPARAALARVGEVEYSRNLGTQAERWIAANPLSFARLALRHLSEFLFPRAWQMYFTGWEGMRGARAITISLVNLAGLAGLAIGLFRRRRGYWALAVYIGLVAMPYTLVQPIQRYIYLVYGLLAFLAVEALVQAVRYRASGPGWER